MLNFQARRIERAKWTVAVKRKVGQWNELIRSRGKLLLPWQWFFNFHCWGNDRLRDVLCVCACVVWFCVWKHGPPDERHFLTLKTLVTVTVWLQRTATFSAVFVTLPTLSAFVWLIQPKKAKNELTVFFFFFPSITNSYTPRAPHFSSPLKMTCRQKKNMPLS